jgi:hypothetical protein
VNGKSQLILFTRLVVEVQITQQLLFCRELETIAAGSDIFDIVNSYFQGNNLYWNNCTDGAAAITRKFKAVLAFAIKDRDR